jgi:hypothetical protein
MSKHHLQSMTEQILNTGHGCAPFHYKQASDQSSKSIEFEDIPIKMVVDERPVRLLAYQIHQEKGGSDLDNWFEAERELVNNY